ncbi:unnamed protein product [Staurois parvus]|uniref:Uncharacterized protein n=1 Tax=Staurois parvus TaxID=386267 RepID=A0ABN9DIF0_9NEOB|nr:unnamed protein product [Staurois parvus]
MCVPGLSCGFQWNTFCDIINLLAPAPPGPLRVSEAGRWGRVFWVM